MLDEYILIVPEIEPKFDIYTNKQIVSKIEKAADAYNLRKNQELILSMNARYLTAIPVLKEKTRITHGDVFQHNVIWQCLDKPFLVDWEAVKKMNPTREAIRTCLAWSGVGADASSLSLFESMLKTYVNSGGSLDKAHAEAALNAMYGNMIFWIIHNIGLVCTGESHERKDAAINEISRTLVSGAKLTGLFSMLLSTIIHI